MRITCEITKYRRWLLVASLAALAPHAAFAQTVPPLGTVEDFAVLAGSTVTNTGATGIVGELGVSPGTAVTGFPPGVVTGGSIHSNDAVAQQAQADLVAAYDDLAGQAATEELTGQDLGGLTLTTGVYRFATSAQLTGTLTLDAQGDPDAVFIFQIGSTLTTASASNVVIINGGSDCNVFWQIGSSATLGTGSSLAGNILALTSITLNTNAALSGRALARNGAVTLDTNSVAVCPAGCGVVTVAPATLPDAQQGVAFSQALTASGGTAPYTFALTSGTLPSGLTLSAAGVIEGIPDSPGSYSFTITATDSLGCPGAQSYTVIVAGPDCPLITLSPASLMTPVLGQGYSETITAAGGSAPYVFAVTAGSLPGGLALAPSGVLAGTPIAPGSFAFTVTATDGDSCPGEQAYAFTIAPGGPGPGPDPQATPVPAFGRLGIGFLVLLVMLVAVRSRTW